MSNLATIRVELIANAQRFKTEIDKSKKKLKEVGKAGTATSTKMKGLSKIFQNTAGSIAAGSTLLITLYPQDFYKLGTVFYKDNKEVQCVQRNELAQMNMSTITKPSEYFPVYVYDNNYIIIYPQTITSDVSVSYIRKPADVTWNFTSTTGYYVWNPTTSVNFELDVSEQTTVILEILKYAGITIKDPMIVQAASQELAANEINEKQ